VPTKGATRKSAHLARKPRPVANPNPNETAKIAPSENCYHMGLAGRRAEHPTLAVGKNYRFANSAGGQRHAGKEKLRPGSLRSRNTLARHRLDCLPQLRKVELSIVLYQPLPLAIAQDAKMVRPATRACPNFLTCGLRRVKRTTGRCREPAVIQGETFSRPVVFPAIFDGLPGTSLWNRWSILSKGNRSDAASAPVIRQRFGTTPGKQVSLREVARKQPPSSVNEWRTRCRFAPNRRLD